MVTLYFFPFFGKVKNHIGFLFICLIFQNSCMNFLCTWYYCSKYLEKFRILFSVLPFLFSFLSSPMFSSFIFFCCLSIFFDIYFFVCIFCESKLPCALRWPFNLFILDKKIEVNMVFDKMCFFSFRKVFLLEILFIFAMKLN